ncbi:hypothetical protein ACA910_010772 [Epithemia clementina (nom. ined.)]
MFLNFWLHPELRRYTGINLTGLFSHKLTHSSGQKPGRKKTKVLWETWNWCAMGLSPSPYQATQSSQRAKWLALGNRNDESNVFRWQQVILNLPGDSRYDPTQPWMYKIRKDGVLAANVHLYVDDKRETGPTEDDAWRATSVKAKTAAYYRLQDATRK